MEAMVLSLWDVITSFLFCAALLFVVINIISFILKKLASNSWKKFVDRRLEQMAGQDPQPPVKYTDIAKVCETLKASYNTNSLRSHFNRKQILYCLYRMLVDNKNAIAEAIRADLHRDISMCICEVESVIVETKYLINEMDKELGRKQVKSNSVQVFCKSFISREPFGCVCVISPWNFPVNLALIPTAGALACGNTVFLKMSKYSYNTSKILCELCDKYIPSEYVRCEYETGREAIQACCDAPFDYYFFTGSTHVGKLVHQAAAKKLVPVTLELGGKNPVIVDRSVNMKVAAKRIAWAKCINGGQICVCPDHVYVPKEMKATFCEEVKKNFISFFGEDQKKSEEFCRIITKNAAKKMEEIIKKSDVYYGGEVDVDSKYVQPTILQNVKIEDISMEEELFGPILPVIEYDTLDEVFEMIKKHPNPLAAYVFTENDDMFEKVVENVNSGAIYKNDAICHTLNSELPFGGNCQSGIGTYHGPETFRTFSRPRTVCKAHTLIDIPVRYWPYGKLQCFIMENMAFWTFPFISYI